MTIRQWFGRRVRWALCVFLVAIGACLLSLVLDPPAAGEFPVAFAVETLSVGVMTAAISIFVFRCPRCRRSLTPFNDSRTWCWWGLAQRLACCPHCAVSLDERMAEPEPVDEHDRYQTDF